jgi:hypothetical protein
VATQTDIRTLVPRVRRALEGAGAPAVLTDDAVKDMIADACADIMLLTGGTLFGQQLVVLERDGNNVPTEYATSDELTFPQQSVIVAQAALNYFFFRFGGIKVSERIGDEGSQWEYTLSANLLRDQLKALQNTRDRAIDAINETGALDEYVSWLSVRDVQTSRMVEPWVYGYGEGRGYGGQEIDYRFGT